MVESPTPAKSSSSTVRDGSCSSGENEFRPELTAEGYARCSIELEPQDGAVKLTISHTIERANSKLIEAVSGGWPRILSNLKSLLETGQITLS